MSKPVNTSYTATIGNEADALHLLCTMWRVSTFALAVEYKLQPMAHNLCTAVKQLTFTWPCVVQSEESFDFAGFINSIMIAEFATVVKFDVFMWGLVVIWVLHHLPLYAVCSIVSFTARVPLYACKLPVLFRHCVWCSVDRGST